MNAQSWFEYLRALVVEQADLRLKLEEVEAITAPKGQQFGSIGHGSGAGDASTRIIKAMEAKEPYRLKYERRQMALERMLEVATTILYGADGRGGLAKERCSADADCILGYYLLAMSWREVADELVRPDSKDGPQWCKRRAYRAFEWMDARRYH